MRKQPDAFLVALGQAVIAAREKRGLSQEGLSFECDLDRTYISGIERGVRNPTVKSLVRLARALRTTPSELFRRAERRAGS
ncbi:MAG: helix-turn-helix domain-containing protein [Actinobacteria bacterium]|nr:helix-turn-helix domain-containing protein [Actinomycetota bacterium]